MQSGIEAISAVFLTQARSEQLINIFKLQDYLNSLYNEVITKVNHSRKRSMACSNKDKNIKGQTLEIGDIALICHPVDLGYKFIFE